MLQEKNFGRVYLTDFYHSAHIALAALNDEACGITTPRAVLRSLCFCFLQHELQYDKENDHDNDGNDGVNDS